MTNSRLVIGDFLGEKRKTKGGKEHLQHSNGRFKVFGEHLQILIITANFLLIGHVARLEETRKNLLTLHFRWFAGCGFICGFIFELDACWTYGCVDVQIGARSNRILCGDLDFGGWFCWKVAFQQLKKIQESGVVLCNRAFQKALKIFFKRFLVGSENCLPQWFSSSSSPRGQSLTPLQ